MIKSVYIAVIFILISFQISTAEPVTRVSKNMYYSEKYYDTLSMSSGQKLTIKSASTLSGMVTLSAGGENCRVVYKKMMKTMTEDDAVDYASVVAVEYDIRADEIIVSLRAPGKAPWSGTNNSARLEVEIYIPVDCDVELNTAYFDINAVGPFSGFIVTESLSLVSVENVNGETEIGISNRPLTLKNIKGGLLISNKYDRIKLENIDTGDKNGVIRNENGEVLIDNYRGGLDVRSSYDKITARGLFLTGEKNRIKNISAPIALDFDSLTTGDLRINNQYGDILLYLGDPTDAMFICKGDDNSQITAANLPLEPVFVSENRLEFKTGQGNAEIRISSRGSGNIRIQGSEK